MLSASPEKPAKPVEIVVRVRRAVDGTWRARAEAADMVAICTGATPEEAASVATREVHRTAKALGREEWFW